MFIFQSDCFSDKLILDSEIVSSTCFWDYWKQLNYSFFGSSYKRASNRLLRVFWNNYDLLSLKKWTAISCDHLEQIYKLMIYPRTTRVILDLSSQFTIEVFCVCLSRSKFFLSSLTRISESMAAFCGSLWSGREKRKYDFRI